MNLTFPLSMKRPKNRTTIDRYFSPTERCINDFTWKAPLFRASTPTLPVVCCKRVVSLPNRSWFVGKMICSCANTQVHESQTHAKRLFKREYSGNPHEISLNEYNAWFLCEFCLKIHLLEKVTMNMGKIGCYSPMLCRLIIHKV